MKVVFANNPLSGLLIAVVLTVANLEASIAGLITASSGLLVSMFMKQNSASISAGLTVYNPLLVGLVTVSVLPAMYDIQMDPMIWVFMMAAAVLSVYVTSALASLLAYMGQHPVPCFTMPFNISQIMLFLIITNMKSYNSYNDLNITMTNSTQPFHGPQNVPLVVLQEGDVSKIGETELLELTDYASTLPGNSLKRYQALPPMLPEVSKTLNSTKPLIFNEIDTLATSHDSGTDIPRTLVNTSNYFENNGDNISENAHSAEYSINLNVNHTKLRNETRVLTSTVVEDLDIDSFTHNSDTSMKEITTVFSNDYLAILETSLFVDEKSNESTKNNINIGGNQKERLKLSLNLTNMVFNQGLDKPENGNETGNVSLLPTGDEMEYGLNLKESFTQSENNLTDTVQDLERHHVDWGQVFAGVVLSMSQVYGYCDPAASTTMYLAILIYSPVMALFAVLGSTLATLTGLLLSDGQYSPVYEGEWGANGILCATALGGFCFVLTVQSATATIVCTLFGAGLQKVLEEPYNQANLPIMSMPFNLCSILFLFLSSVSKKGFIRPPTLSFPEKHLFEWSQLRHESKENPDVMTEMAQEVEPSSEKKTPLTEQEIA
uniref:Urea transporter n=1 Tax=Timema poppense TaxID=170557 RepID=A0A7R9CPE6_TIMPO|nr:unnamed protein product [Timema poppensis]